MMFKAFSVRQGNRRPEPTEAGTISYFYYYSRMRLNYNLSLYLDLLQHQLKKNM